MLHSKLCINLLYSIGFPENWISSGLGRFIPVFIIESASITLLISDVASLGVFILKLSLLIGCTGGISLIGLLVTSSGGLFSFSLRSFSHWRRANLSSASLAAFFFLKFSSYISLSNSSSLCSSSSLISAILSAFTGSTWTFWASDLPSAWELLDKTCNKESFFLVASSNWTVNSAGNLSANAATNLALVSSNTVNASSINCLLSSLISFVSISCSMSE